MKYPYIVNHNGIYYPAGTDVPVGDEVQKIDIPFAESEALEEPEITDEAIAEVAKRGRPPKSKQ